MGDKTEKVLGELEDYHKKAKEKIEEKERPKEVKVEKEVKKEKPKEEKKSGKKMGEEKEITIKIRIKPRVIERIAYITVILVLIYFAFFRNISIDISMPSFGRESGVTVTTPTGNETAETVTNETVDEEEETEETTTETETTTTGKIDAELVFNNDNIGTSGEHPSVKVTSITYKIRNKGDDLYSLVEVYWYDEDDTAVIKSKVRASYKLKISAGRVATKTITSFPGGTYLNSDNRKETFVLKLYDDKTGKKLDEVTTYFTPP